MNKQQLKLTVTLLVLFSVLLWGVALLISSVFFRATSTQVLLILLLSILGISGLFSIVLLKRMFTDQKNDKEKFSYLEERNYMFEKFLEHTPIYVFFKDAEIRTLALSQNYEQMLGMPVENALGKTMDDLFPSDLAKSMIEDDKKILNKGEVFEVFEEMHDHHYRTLKFPIEADNKTKYLAGFTIDITELHNLEMDLRQKTEELQKSVDEFNLIFNTMQDVFFRVDTTQSFQIISPSAGKLLGISLDDIKMNTLQNLFLDKEAFDTFQQELLDKNEVAHFECQLKAKNGAAVWVSINANSERDENGVWHHTNGIIRDITIKQKLEAEKLKNQKIESISILAGGIAHDFNNVMTGVMGNVSLALQGIAPSSNEALYLKKAETAMERAAILSNKLLTFSSGGEPVKQECSLYDIIETSIDESCVEGSVRPKVSFEQNLPFIECDPIQMTQVFANIMINAIQATDADDSIEIAVHRYTQSADSVVIPKGDYFKITISDTGCGIPASNILKVYDPFFTTKTEASGLGLATAYSIIKKHGGGIDFESLEGYGTTFLIYLPVSPHAIEKRATQKPLPPKTSQAPLKLLIMDDEEIILMVCKEMCKIMGYTVDTATDGTIAIARYKEALKQNRRYDIVIMDLTIPGGMGGKETMAKLIEIDPQVKAIVSSGYSNEPIMSHFEKYGFIDAIAKPYNFDMFKEVLSKH